MGIVLSLDVRRKLYAGVVSPWVFQFQHPNPGFSHAACRMYHAQITKHP